MKRVPAKTPRPYKEARGIKFQPPPAPPKPKASPAKAAKPEDTADESKA
jgi:hypothetical protein